MSAFRNKIQIAVKPDICIFTALALFCIPWRWFFAWIFAAAFHELCHYAVLRLCGYRATGLLIGMGGVLMRTESLTPVSETLSAAAGPIGSLVLTLLSPIMPRIAVCGFFHFLYNLLPVYPQDGGRVLRGILMCILPPVSAERITQIMGGTVVLLLMIAAICGCLWSSLGLWPLLAMLILILKIKIPCKRRQLRVQ